MTHSFIMKSRKCNVVCGMSSVGQDDVMGRIARMQWQTEWLFYHELEPTKPLVEALQFAIQAKILIGHGDF